MRMLAALLAFVVTLLGCTTARDTADEVRRQPAYLGSTGSTPQTQDRFTYLAGTGAAGGTTVLVPTGSYVTSIWAHNTSGGGSVVITPSSPTALSPCDAGADAANSDGGSNTCLPSPGTIIVPAATAWSLGIPVLKGGYEELADGTSIVFTSIDSYAVTLYHYGP